MQPRKSGKFASVPIMERIWSKTDIKSTDECWIWKGSHGDRGYGQVWYKNDMWMVTRVIYEELREPIPPRFYIMHSCDNPPCVNPKHLSAGSPSDNRIDCEKKGRSKNQNKGKTKCYKGHLFTPENTYQLEGGWRACKTCVSERSKINYKRSREKCHALADAKLKGKGEESYCSCGREQDHLPPCFMPPAPQAISEQKRRKP